MNEKLMRAAGLSEEMDLILQKKCPFCRKQVIYSEFTDALSQAEFTISGFCQKCQDEVFG